MVKDNCGIGNLSHVHLGFFYNLILTYFIIMFMLFSLILCYIYINLETDHVLSLCMSTYVYHHDHKQQQQTEQKHRNDQS